MLPTRRTSEQRRGAADVLLIVFLLWAMLSVLFAVEKTQAAVYAGSSWLVVCFLARCGDDWQRTAVLIGLTLTGLLLGALMWHGMPQNRWIGGVHPNQFAAVGVAAMLCLLWGGWRSRAVGLSVGFLAAVLVNSRTALLDVTAVAGTLSVFRLIRALKARETGYRAIVLTTAGVVVGSILVVCFQDAVVGAVRTMLALDDRSRGIGTGLTHRTESWGIAWRALTDHWLVGYGYRADYEVIPRTHSGYFDLALQVGITGLAAFVGALVLRGIEWALAAVEVPGKNDAVQDAEAAACSILVGLVHSAFERVLVNLGFPLSLVLWVVLVRRPLRRLQPARHEPRRVQSWLHAGPLVTSRRAATRA